MVAAATKAGDVVAFLRGPARIIPVTIGALTLGGRSLEDGHV